MTPATGWLQATPSLSPGFINLHLIRHIRKTRVPILSRAQHTAHMKYLKFLSCFILFASALNAQSLLTLEDAVRIALENNYDVRIAANSLSIDRNNVTYGNAGFLPSVGADFSNNNSLESTRQNRSDGTVREGNNVSSSGTNYGVGLELDRFQRFQNVRPLRPVEGTPQPE